MKRLNKKGFTLVELLAVIVILALIMAIAIYSISGILQRSREDVFKDTALNIIHGVRNELLSLNNQEAGTYYFTSDLLENNNDLPFGGKIKYVTSSLTEDMKVGSDGPTVERISSSGGATSLYKTSSVSSLCTPSSRASYVRIAYEGGKYIYSICLVPTGQSESSGRYISGTEAALMGNSVQTIFSMTNQESGQTSNG